MPTVVLTADPARVLARLFVPGSRALARRPVPGVGGPGADPRAARGRGRRRRVKRVRDRYPGRHRDLPGVLMAHYERIAHRIPDDAELSDERRSLVGAWFTHEYSVEAAALFNPSVVVHPDQTGLEPGQLPVRPEPARGRRGAPVLAWSSARGVVGPAGSCSIDDPGPHIESGRTLPTWYDRGSFAAALAGQDIDRESAAFVVARLPARFHDDELEAALADLAGERLTRPTAARTADLARRIAACSYEVEFPPETALAERVLWPQSPSRVARDRGRPLRARRGRRRLPGDLHRVRRRLDRPAADRDRRLPALPDVPAGRAGRAEQGHGPVPAAGRRPLRRPLPLGPGEQRPRHVRRRGLVGRRRARCRRRAVRGSCSSSGTAVRRSRPRPAGSC